MIARLTTFAGKLGENVLLTIITALILSVVAALCWAGRVPNLFNLLPRQTEVRLTNLGGAPMAQVALMEARCEGAGWKVGAALGVTDENGCATISVGPGIQGLYCVWGTDEKLLIRNADATVWTDVCRISPAMREVRLVVKHPSPQDARSVPSSAAEEGRKRGTSARGDAARGDASARGDKKSTWQKSHQPTKNISRR